ncbi:MAG: molybdenum cofactor biosynthesis protein MoaE [Candidatus Poseidoniales archaeon]|jgi:molybdopterin synthase catalytic subunit|nr:molybdenum cofactor biosynthesis protein MoaE [Candidatus Poseidoniales archaeon]|tara:strand:- start:4324 stop:4752 length:429 start_codon:yes stop_codon:yes gene_type:complete
MSEDRIVVHVESEKLQPEKLRSLLNTNGCGSVVSFVGLTRGTDQGVSVERLEFDAWENKLPTVLYNIAKNSISQFNVNSVVIAHRVGHVFPSEPIVCIHVGSIHRNEGFDACSWLITELKSQAPLWKKEIRSDGDIWKKGLG